MILLKCKNLINDHKLNKDMQVYKIIGHSYFAKKAVANQ